ncbi:MAG: acetyl-CoA acetyltransferase [Candidatus Binatia bacterium]|nr:MAG: acetyl-CoA acetyltransferase [Candidatus Binatia bacterium]
MDENLPVLVGGGQITQKDVEPREALEPLGLMVEAARRAAEDARLPAGALEKLDCVAVVHILAAGYANAPRFVAEALGARPATEIYTTVGGNTPQFLLNELASRIARGETRFALLAGAEAIHTLRAARKSGLALAWTKKEAPPPTVLGDERPGTSEHESAHGLRLPTQVYPLFENAIRASRGWTIEEHLRRLGELCARFAAVAAENPYAWFRDGKDARTIATVTPQNRMVGFPYPKYMNAIMEVDQGAAVLLASAEFARSLGIPRERWVYPWCGAEGHDRWFVSDRVDFVSSPAIRRLAGAAFEALGLDTDRVDFFDLYSCFPSAVQIARDMIGIREDDPRPLTVTGGLPYHGGPGNNYTTHAIATMIEKLRSRRGAIGFVSALGWFITKHAVGIYSSEPPPRGRWTRLDHERLQADIDALVGPAFELRPEGRAYVETYTVFHDREGKPVEGFVFGRLENRKRFLSHLPADPELLASFTREEGVGRKGRVRPENGTNLFVPD